MPTAFVLYLNDDIVGPCLELIRKISDPTSTSKPHITVRYVGKLENSNLQIYNKFITDIDFIKPGCFGLGDDSSQHNKTVFIKCASDALETLSHKPHFPDSVFHITLYDGTSNSFALKLLDIVSKYNWNFNLKLPLDTKLSKISIKSKNIRKRSSSHIYSDNLIELFKIITGFNLNYEYVISLSDDDRLDIVQTICNYLHSKIDLYSGSNYTIKRYLNRSARSFNQELNTSPVPSPLCDDTFPHLLKLYLTPPELALDIVKYAVSQLSTTTTDIHFGDPAIGTGVFFSALRQVLPQEKIASAIGIEIDHKRAVATMERWAHWGLQVLSGDYLHMETLPKRTLVIANPPYLRYQLLKPKYLNILRERASINLGIKINGQSGLYVYFMLLSHEWYSQDAVAAWLIPSEFMDTNYGSAIRYYLTHKVELIRIHRFNPDDIQFDNALVSSAVVVIRNRRPKAKHKAIISYGGPIDKPFNVEVIDNDRLRTLYKWKIPFNSLAFDSYTGPRLGDLFTVKRGIATGANSFFIMEKEVAIKKGIPESVLRPVIPKSRALDNDIIESDSNGNPLVSPKLVLLDTSDSEETILLKYPRLMEYLNTADNELRNRTLVKKRNPWYRQEKRDAAPFLCTYMGRGDSVKSPIRFIWNKSNAIATNVYLLLYPVPKLSILLADKPHLYEDLFYVLQYASSQGMTQYGRVYGGGLNKIEPKELLEVQLTKCPDWLNDIVETSLFESR
jgi:hypothetical protein